MILQCKNCNARYLVPDNAIGAEGRTVRCARCQHEWFEPHQDIESGEISETRIEVPDLDTIIGSINATASPIPEGSNLPVHRARTPTGLKAMVAICAILIVALSLFIVKPRLFGIVPSKGMVFSDIQIQKGSGDNSSTVEISGNIFNTSNVEGKVPNIRVILLDSMNNPIQSWEFKTNGEMLKAGATIPFTTGDLNVKFTLAKRFVIDMGTPIELALRRKP